MTYVNPVSPTPPPASPPPERSDGLGKDAFLKLLVAQLRYQNPLEPTDPSQFLAQTAQFTMVEKLEELARQGAARQAGTDLVAAGALIGRRVTYRVDGVEHTGIVRSVRFDPSAPPAVDVGDREVPMDAIEVLSGPAGPGS